MSTNFPTTLDTLGDPGDSDKIKGNVTTALDLKQQLKNLNDAVEAIQAKLGINSSGDATSIDYKVNTSIPATLAALPITRDAVNGRVYTATSTDDLIIGQTSTEYASGTHLKMMFDQSKGAFRAGQIAGAYWDDASRGTTSTAFGTNTTASGADSFAAGNLSVASGASSVAFVAATASGSGSVGMSETGTASGSFSFLMPGRTGGSATRHSQHSHPGYLASGTAQGCEFMATLLTTNATPTVMLFDGGSLTSNTATLTGTHTNVLTVPINTAHKFILEVVARNTTTPGTFASYHITGSIVRSSSGDARFISVPVVVADEDAGAALWDCAVTVNTSNGTNNYLVITVTGAAATNITWVAKLSTVQNSV